MTKQPSLFDEPPVAVASEAVERDPLDDWRQQVSDQAYELCRTPAVEWPRALKTYFDSRVDAQGWSRMPPTHQVLEEWIKAGRPNRWGPATSGGDGGA